MMGSLIYWILIVREFNLEKTLIDITIYLYYRWVYKYILYTKYKK